MAQVAITGNTYPVKDQLKAIGAKWDADRKCWTITESKAAEARKIVAGTPQQTANATPGKCLKCHGPVKEPHKICFKCKNIGKCLNCGAQLDNWERQHGVKRCGECRDGGDMANGGQSYYDRNGRFVLGADD